MYAQQIIRITNNMIDMKTLHQKAQRLGATDLGLSPSRYKRLYVIYQNKIIHFGAKDGNTFIDHRDPKKRSAWIARHSKVKNKDGVYVINLRTSPSYWSRHILW